jgi:LTXXQ motif family protein
MRRTLMFLATAAAVAGSVVAGSAVAQDRGGRWDRADRSDRSDRTDRSALTAHQIAAETDVGIARMKADLRLTADQEKNWPGIETALRDLGQRRADRQVAFRAEGAKKEGSDDIIASLNRSSGFLSDRSADMKKLADAAQPLYAGLDEQQKKRFSQALIRVSGDRDN